MGSFLLLRAHHDAIKQQQMLIKRSLPNHVLRCEFMQIMHCERILYCERRAYFHTIEMEQNHQTHTQIPTIQVTFRIV